MKSNLIYLLLGVMAGFCVCLEGTLNSLLGRHIGVLKAAMAPFLTGFLTLLLIIVLFDWGKGTTNISALFRAPWYSYLGGLWAVAFVSLVIFIVPKVGITAGLSAVIVGQLVTSLIFDATGVFSLGKIPISYSRLFGAALLLVGMHLIYYRDL